MMCCALGLPLVSIGTNIALKSSVVVKKIIARLENETLKTVNKGAQVGQQHFSAI
jgi:hypothetical protein